MKKILAFLAFLLLSASPALAMTTPILLLNPGANLVNNATRDFPLGFNGGGSGAGGGALNQTKMPIAGTFSKITVALPYNLTSGSIQISLTKNAVNTALTCTFTSGSSSCTDSTHTVSVVAGDLMGFDINPISTPVPSPAGSLQAAVQFDGTTADETFVVGGMRLTNTSAAQQTGPLGNFDGGLVSDIESSEVFPTSGTLDDLYMATANPPASGGGGSWQAWLRKGTTISNEATTSLTCTIANAGTSCSDLVDSVAVSAGDIVSMVNNETGTTLSNQTGIYSFRFKPTVDGESVMLSRFDTGQSSGINTYAYTGGVEGNNDTEGSSTATTQSPFTWKKLFVVFDTAPGSTRSRAITARINAVGTALTCSVADTNTTCNDTTHTVSVSAGNSVAWQNTPTNSPTGTVNLRIGAVLFIAPAVTATVPHIQGFLKGVRGFFMGVKGFFE